MDPSQRIPDIQFHLRGIAPQRIEGPAIERMPEKPVVRLPLGILEQRLLDPTGPH
jgi:hypothetical protein